MPDYSLSKIYKLVSNKTSDIYIGSCVMRLSTRLSTHKSKSNSCVSRKLFVEDAVVTIILIENFACNTKNELKARELHHITTNKCINVNKPFVCDIPYADTKAWKKEYNTINAEQIRAYKDTNRDRANALQRARRAEKKLALNLQNNLNKNIIV